MTAPARKPRRVNRVPWATVWAEYEEWFERRCGRACKTCGHKDLFKVPEWEDQQKFIQRAVEYALERQEAMP